jgi:hypothetical protein
LFNTPPGPVWANTKTGANAKKNNINFIIS